MNTCTNCSANPYTNHCHICSKFYTHTCDKNIDWSIYSEPDFTCDNFLYGYPIESLDNNGFADGDFQFTFDF